MYKHLIVSVTKFIGKNLITLLRANFASPVTCLALKFIKHARNYPWTNFFFIICYKKILNKKKVIVKICKTKNVYENKKILVRFKIRLL